MAEIVPGSVIAAAWRIERLLGRGGMGSVYLSTELKTGRAVALKLLDPRFAADDDALTRFKREGEITRGLRHPGVVQIYDAGFDLGHWYLAMELLEGETAEQLLGHVGPLSPGQCAALMIPVLEVLEVAHASGVIHRDLKPANVFLAAGEPPSVKVLDFGVSRAGGGATRITRAGVMMGTLCYMAPEQMMDTASSSERSDLYSVGAMMFELLTGERPFDGRSDASLIERILVQAAPVVAQTRGDVPPMLSGLVDRLMRKSPAERPASARAVRLELASIVKRDGTGLFEGFAGGPRRSAVVVEAGEAGGLDPTYVRPPPQLPRRVNSPPVAEVAAPPVEPPRPASKALVWGLVAAAVIAATLTIAAFVVPALDTSAPVHVDEAPQPIPSPRRASAAKVSAVASLALPVDAVAATLDTAHGFETACPLVLLDVGKAVPPPPMVARVMLNQCLVAHPNDPGALYAWARLLGGPTARVARQRYYALFLRTAQRDHPKWAEVSRASEPVEDSVPKNLEADTAQEAAHRLVNKGQSSLVMAAEDLFKSCTQLNPFQVSCYRDAAKLEATVKNWPRVVANDLAYLDLMPNDVDTRAVREEVARHVEVDIETLRYH